MNPKLTLADANKLLLEGSLVMARMGANGIRIHEGNLKWAMEEIDEKVRGVEDELYRDKVWRVWKTEFGAKANLDSRHQMGRVLFEKMGIKSTVRTHTGRHATNRAAFEDIDLPFVQAYEKRATYNKTRQTYLKGIQRETVDGLFHATINLHTVTTYRSSSGADKSEDRTGRDINLQNLPIRNPEIGPLIRKCFVPRSGWALAESDFAAHEFKICAAVWEDPAMIEYANDPAKDIHRDMAMKIFRCGSDQWTKALRQEAKANFVFATLYGSYYIQCARRLWNSAVRNNLKIKDGSEEVPVIVWLKKQGIRELGDCDPTCSPRKGTFEAHMKKVEDEFFKTFSKFARDKEAAWEAYKKVGWFDMVTGFRVGGICSKNFLQNSLVQGPAFHCLLLADIEVQRRIEKRRMRTKLVGQIHDCTLADVPTEEIQDYLHMMKDVVRNYLPERWKWVRAVKLDAEAEVTPVGGTWADKEQWVEVNNKWVPKKKVA